MADTLRIGLIGAGANTRLRHIPGFQALDGVEVVAVCNRTDQSGHRIADEFGIDRVETDPEALFGSPDIDAICIGTWPYRHREFVVRALAAGKHVLTEARMAMDATEAREMLAAAQARPDLVAQIVPGPFDLKSYQTVQRLIREGALGAIREVHVSALSGAALNPDTPLHWREQRQFSGTNVMTFGIYVEIVTRWLGPTRRVLADGAVFVDSRIDAASGERRAIDVPDSLEVFAQLESGARVTYRFGSTLHAPPAGAASNGISVYGERGTLHWAANDTMQFAPLGQDAQPLEPDAGTAEEWRVEADFVDSIRNGAPVRLTNFEDGLAYMRVTEAVDRSRATGRAVDIADV